ncbi:50S ribosomal protein L31 [Candidatus Marinimicrobia bacterium]|nr:50S ribosomal protein L31 [Candidatus Neomarinimicrobiota bacterium]
MKANTHPEYKLGNIVCSCGHTFQVYSTTGDQHIELCSECHPFYTGKQKLVDTAGRIEKFKKKYGKTNQ